MVRRRCQARADHNEALERERKPRPLVAGGVGSPSPATETPKPWTDYDVVGEAFEFLVDDLATWAAALVGKARPFAR